jgi:DNA uptake protein ComE-like DNA-binding protein
MDKNPKNDEFVNVSVRIKPLGNGRITNSSLQVIQKHPAVLLVLDRAQTYHFDNIFTDGAKQEDVYKDSVKLLVENVKGGYNCTVFAYGQTGTGKTYTIGTNPNVTNEDESGLISRTLEDFFSATSENNEIEIDISFIEIYNEKVFDLLSVHNKNPLSIKGFSVCGFDKVRVHNTFEALLHLKNGGRNRHTGETKQNLSSSRSHAIFTIYCHLRNNEKETMAKLNLVDLAGSESARKTGNQGSSFYEGININKGLLSLGQVMMALSTNSIHIPYRQSVITTILQDSLNRKNFVSLIACVSSNVEDLGETLQTLEFANRVKKMKNKPEVNEFILQYKHNNPNIFLNCPSRGLTPSKKSSYETPFKKNKTVMPVIQEPVAVNSSNFEISPLFSSSLTSVVSDTPQNFSPVIKKYINAMEDSIINRLQDVIKTTLRKPAGLYKEDKENFETPRVCCSTEEDPTCELSNLGDGEITKNLKQHLDSSKNVIKSRKFLTYNYGHNLISSTEEKEDNAIFKIPAPGKSKNMLSKNTVQRSSQRLQMKKCISELNLNEINGTPNKTLLLEHVVTTNEPALEESNRRRSVRLQVKRSATQGGSEFKKRVMNVPHKKQEANTDNEETSRKNTSRTNESSLIFDFPCKKRPKNKLDAKDTPITARRKYVLNILNSGTLRELEKLHTVGAKTAEKIQLFRQLKGKFKYVSDIANMPYWTKKKYEKFEAENFLRR